MVSTMTQMTQIINKMTQMAEMGIKMTKRLRLVNPMTQMQKSNPKMILSSKSTQWILIKHLEKLTKTISL
jgi:hypothetical protein